MNKVLLNLNSYTQTAQILINGREPSVYSELANYTYKHFSEVPDVVLDAIARELNDDFTLSVCGNLFECSLYSVAVSRNSYCLECKAIPPAVRISSQKRAGHLSRIMQEKSFYVSVTGIDGINISTPVDPLEYGNLSVVFNADYGYASDLTVQVSANEATIYLGTSTISLPRSVFSAELLVSACETYLINPAIGQTVANVRNISNDIAICSRLTPIISAHIPENIESGTKTEITASTYPAGCAGVKIAVTSSNPDVVSVDGISITANNPGTATVHVFVAGENKPFYSQNVTVKKTIYASSLVIEGLGKPLQEGEVVPLQVKAIPRDAIDLNEVVWVTSDPTVATVVDGALITKGPGVCIVRAKTPRIHTDAKVTVAAKLRALEISKPEITTSVGRSVPVSVQTVPENAYNAKYRWKTSDDSVAIVVNEDGQEFVKAVGIGSCEVTCISKDGKVSDKCKVNVESLMYKKKRKSPIKSLLFMSILVIVFFAVKIAFTSNDMGDAYIVNQEANGNVISENDTTSADYSTDTGYLSDPSLIPQELISELAAHAISVQTEENEANTGGFTYSEVQYCGAAFSLPSEDNFFPEYYNALNIFVCYEGSMVGGGLDIHYTYYTPMQIKNISLNADGTLNLNAEDGVFASYFTNDLDSAIEHLADGNRYTIIRID